MWTVLSEYSIMKIFESKRQERLAKEEEYDLGIVIAMKS